jgi:phenylacetate-CoA ligase
MIYRAARVSSRDRLLFPFSFGPFIGFWAAFESSAELGCLSLPGGGMTTSARLRFMIENGCTVLCCTPTYALHMAEVAASEGIDLPASPVQKLIVAVSQAWGARVYDHSGMTEVGPFGFECDEAPGGMHLLESEFIAEVVDPVSCEPVTEGNEGELVLTNLGRLGSPLIRYRTNDRVRLTRERCACGRSFARMERGILGRVDDMVVVRGNSVFPAALDEVIWQVDGIAEYRAEVVETDSLSELIIQVEPKSGRDGQVLSDGVKQAVQDSLNFRAQVSAVAMGSLPRFEMKAKRFTRRRTAPGI